MWGLIYEVGVCFFVLRVCRSEIVFYTWKCSRSIRRTTIISRILVQRIVYTLGYSSFLSKRHTAPLVLMLQSPGFIFLSLSRGFGESESWWVVKSAEGMEITWYRILWRCRQQSLSTYGKITHECIPETSNSLQLQPIEGLNPCEILKKSFFWIKNSLNPLE